MNPYQQKLLARISELNQQITDIENRPDVTPDFSPEYYNALLSDWRGRVQEVENCMKLYDAEMSKAQPIKSIPCTCTPEQAENCMIKCEHSYFSQHD